jgi:leucine dehydrogenase
MLNFLINAGGINVYAELAHYGKEIMSKTENIYNTTLEIIDYAVLMELHASARYHTQNRIDQRKIENSKIIYFFNKLRVTVFRIALNCDF